ncbi:hypothetical protein [Staphylococcus argenteus]|uniref:hypothetical protein n=1 Tax=Staphylococcus argenteus TaxID=985002 RepID=UPI001FB929F0|nr:hypothetical protein [Staphylococcus argenteus]MCG9794574.1 hypothetical protein [Staphylococcus argenteus]GJF44028.1 hypothetical protein SA19061_11180 [Staphylococcus argenteus]GJF55441.1 hypothetical protein SA19088_21840 [Staphylococcus argenteus]GJF60409.1 hypothetical protein SA19105_18970 [Staphylococcus argenteus]GJF71940.1 hypothetical protein SA19202_05480 [Staphylococcus argenteus]
MNCQTENIINECVRYTEQLSAFDEFRVVDILEDLSVVGISESTLYYICEKFKLLVLQNNVMGIQIIEDNTETVCEVKYKKIF